MSENPFNNGLYAGVDPMYQTDPVMLNGSYDEPAAEPEVEDVPPPPLVGDIEPDGADLSTPPPLAGGESDESFDPGKHNVDEVNAYLDDASAEERARVLALELEGKGRSGILTGPHAEPTGE